MTDTDESLLAQIAEGNEQAMERFYDRFHPIVYNFALRRMREPSDAGEIVNQVMLEIWRTAARFEHRSKVQTWLLGITQHKIVDCLRKQGKFNSEELSEDIVDESCVSMVDVIALEQHAELIRVCLDKLSSEHREVIHLAFYEDLPYSDIAAIIDRPEGTVKTRVFHAKTNLKKCLQRVLEDEK